MPRFSAGRKSPDPERRRESDGTRQGGSTVSGGVRSGKSGRTRGSTKRGPAALPRRPETDSTPSSGPVKKSRKSNEGRSPTAAAARRKGTSNPHPKGPSFPKKMPRPNTTKRR